jgi:membrane protein YqaA with SNARE-associated domain
MKGFITWLQNVAVTIGGPGLFIIAFLDSSFLSLPEVNDLLVVTAVTRHPHRWLYYATAATLGSLAGCLALYYVSRRGGEAFIRSRFSTGRVERTMRLFQRHGLLALLVPALLPPPAPFKLFVLLAGVAGIPALRFSLAVVVGRGTRFLVIGWLAARYGQQTIEFLHEHGRTVALVVAGLIVAGALGWWLWTRRRGAAL